MKKALGLGLAAFLLATLAFGDDARLTRSGRLPRIAADGRGGFVAVWTEVGDSGQEIFARQLGPDGGRIGPAFQVNTRAAGLQDYPAVAVGPRGDFMVVWQGGRYDDPTGGDGDHEGVFGQLFSRAGVKQGRERRLSQQTAGPQLYPSVAAVPDGGFVAGWMELSLHNRIFARRFSTSGAPLGPDLLVPAAGEYNSGPLIAAYPGGFVAGWGEGTGCSGGRTDASVLAIAPFNAAGERTGRVFRYGTGACDEVFGVASLLGSRAGALAILVDPSGYSIQRFAPSGQPVGGQFRLSRRFCSGQRCEYLWSAAMDDRGRFAVVWDVVDGGFHRLFVQAFTPRGRPLTDRIPVSADATTTPSSTAVALANDGALAVIWSRVNLDDPAGTTSLYVRRFQLP